MVYKESAKATYVWREGFPTHGVKAQVVGEVLDAIFEQHGDLTPQLICAEARKSTSPLRPFIEQNRRLAATAYQHHQAELLRGAVKRVWVSYSGEVETETVVQAFIRHPTMAREDSRSGEPLRSHVFVPVAQIMSDEEARAAQIRVALRELAAWRRRYQSFHELGQLFAALDAEAKAAADLIEQELVAVEVPMSETPVGV